MALAAILLAGLALSPLAGAQFASPHEKKLGQPAPPTEAARLMENLDRGFPKKGHVLPFAFAVIIATSGELGCSAARANPTCLLTYV
ncbi:MAG: hypothetical protein ACREIA_00570, partial [Opitutaceae bacterium]